MTTTSSVSVLLTWDFVGSLIVGAVSGKLILVMEDGSETLIENPGDVVVQRGTVHAWKNPGPEWVRWVTILIDAQPAVVNGVALQPYLE